MALYGLTSLENRKAHRNDIIKHYHETFVDSLKKFGYKKNPPTLKALNDELTKNGALGAQLCICYLPYLLADWSDIDSDVFYNADADADSAKRKMYLNRRFGDVIEEEFEAFFDQGFI